MADRARFVSIYKATETVNFAQGELMMLGASSASRWSPSEAYWVALPVAFVGMWLVACCSSASCCGDPGAAFVHRRDVTIGIGFIAAAS